MKIEIPKSLFDIIISYMDERHWIQNEKLSKFGPSIVGPYGIYQIVAKPDEEYTEEVQGVIRRYKD